MNWRNRVDNLKPKEQNIAKRKLIRLSLAMIAILFFVNQSGFILWQSARTVCYQYLRTKQLSKERDTIILTSNEFKNELAWIKKDEVRYKGQMFDVKRKFELNGNIILTGHFDKHEDHLFQWLGRLFNDKEPLSNSKHKFQLWFCEALLPTVVMPSRSCFPTVIEYCDRCIFGSSPFRFVASPPPEGIA